MLFPDAIIRDGYLFRKVDEYVNARGYEKADYYNPNHWGSHTITLTGDFVSQSI